MLPVRGSTVALLGTALGQVWMGRRSGASGWAQLAEIARVSVTAMAAVTPTCLLLVMAVGHAC
jgi:hypothetical protein